MGRLCDIKKEKKSSKNFAKSGTRKLVPDFSVFAKNYAQPLLKKKVFKASYSYYIYNSKTIKICLDQHPDLFRFSFTEDSLKIKKGLELVFKPHFTLNFLIKRVFLIPHKLTKFHYHTVFTFQGIQ